MNAEYKSSMSLALNRNSVRTFPTPDERDVLFYVTIDSTKESNHSFEYGSPWPKNDEYAGHKLVYVEPADKDGILKVYYMAPPEDQDLYNFEFTEADIGGTRFKAVKRTYLFLRSEFNPTGITPGTQMPDSPAGLFGGEYILAYRNQTRSSKELDSIFVSEERIYIKRSTISANRVDEITGESLPSVKTWYYATEIVPGTGLTAAALFANQAHAYWGLKSDGSAKIGEQISAEWYVIDDTRVVPWKLINGVTYETNEDYYWPPVLSQVEFISWPRRNGGIDIFPRVVMLREAYRGPCKASVTESWSLTPVGTSAVNAMLPVGVDYACPFFRISVPDCLHGSLSFVCDIGTADPDYKQTSGTTRTFNATNYQDWPSSLVVSSTQKRYNGGYLNTTVTVYRPS